MVFLDVYNLRANPIERAFAQVWPTLAAIDLLLRNHSSGVVPQLLAAGRSVVAAALLPAPQPLAAGLSVVAAALLPLSLESTAVLVLVSRYLDIKKLVVLNLATYSRR